MLHGRSEAAGRLHARTLHRTLRRTLHWTHLQEAEAGRGEASRGGGGPREARRGVRLLLQKGGAVSAELKESARERTAVKTPTPAEARGQCKRHAWEEGGAESEASGPKAATLGKHESARAPGWPDVCRWRALV
jgi:hypothetical protein